MFRDPQPFPLVKDRENLGSLLSHMYFSLAERKKVPKRLLKVSKSLKVQLNLIFTLFFSPNPQFLHYSPSENCFMSFPFLLFSPAAFFSLHVSWSHLALPSDGSHTINWGERRIFPASMRIAAQLQCIPMCWCQSACCCQSLFLSRNQIKKNLSDLATKTLSDLASYIKPNKGVRQQTQRMLGVLLHF